MHVGRMEGVRTELSGELLRDDLGQRSLSGQGAEASDRPSAIRPAALIGVLPRSDTKDGPFALGDAQGDLTRKLPSPK